MEKKPSKQGLRDLEKNWGVNNYAGFDFPHNNRPIVFLGIMIVAVIGLIFWTAFGDNGPLVRVYNTNNTYTSDMIEPNDK